MRNVAIITALSVLTLSLTFGAQDTFAQETLAAGIKLVSEKNPDVHDAQSLIKSIIKPDMTPEQKAVAIFDYLVKHSYHHNAPEEPNADGLENRKYSGEVTKLMDPIKNLNVYGHAICGSQSWYQNFLYNAVGLKGRIDGVSGHTVSEVKYGDKWHYFDVDMMGYVRNKEGAVVSVDEIKADKNLLFEKHPKRPEMFFKYDGPRGMWGCLNVGVKYSMYGRKLSAHSMNLTLRDGEKFVRYFKRQWAPKFRYYAAWSGSAYNKRLRSKYNRSGGPSRDKTHFLFKEGNVARFGNWEWSYDAPLAKPSALAGTFAVTNVKHTTAAPFLQPEKADAASEVIYKYYSPYGCAGCPNDLSKLEDDTDGAIFEGEFANEAGSVSLSLDLGKSWEEVHKGGGAFKVDLTPKLGGRYGWLIKLSFKGAGSGVKAYKSYLSGQLSPASLPYVDGKTKMTFKREHTDCILFHPDITKSKEELDRLAHKVENYAQFSPSISGHHLFQGNTGSVIFKVEAPNDITRIHTAAQYGARKGTTLNGIAFSVDDGKTWLVGCQQPIVKDEDHPEEFWGQSVDAILDFSEKKAYSLGCTPGTNAIRETAFDGKPVKSVLVKYFTKGGDGKLIKSYGIYVHYKKQGKLPLTITHKWKGGEHAEKISADEDEKTYEIAGGALATNESITIEAGDAK